MDSKDFDLKTFGGRLAFAIDYRGSSQLKLSKALGVSQQAVSGWVKNKNECKYTFEVAQELRIRPQWLISGDGDMVDERNEFLKTMEMVDDHEIQSELSQLALRRLLEKGRI